MDKPKRKMEYWYMKEETALGTRETWGYSPVVEKKPRTLKGDIEEFLEKHEALSLDRAEDRTKLAVAMRNWILGRKEWNQ